MSNFVADIFSVNGIFDWQVQFDPSEVDHNSVVLVSACELNQNEIPFKGLAVFTVHNVVPNDGGIVELTIDTGWTGNPINVRANFAVNPS